MVQGFWRRVVLGAVLLAMTGGAWGLWQRWTGPEPQIQGIYDNLDVAVEDLQLVQGAKGRKTWELQARKSWYERSKGRIEFEQPKIRFFGDKEGVKIQAKAPSGVYLQEQGVAELWPRVHARSGNSTVQARRMIFKRKTQSVLFRDEVVINHPQANATSDRAVFDLQSSEMVLTGHVEVHIYAHKKDS